MRRRNLTNEILQILDTNEYPNIEVVKPIEEINDKQISEIYDWLLDKYKSGKQKNDYSSLGKGLAEFLLDKNIINLSLPSSTFNEEEDTLDEEMKFYNYYMLQQRMINKIHEHLNPPKNQQKENPNPQ